MTTRSRSSATSCARRSARRRQGADRRRPQHHRNAGAWRGWRVRRRSSPSIGASTRPRIRRRPLSDHGELDFSRAGREVTAEQRQVGNSTTLAFQYQGGLGAFRRIAPDDDFSDQGRALQAIVARGAPSIERLWHADRPRRGHCRTQAEQIVRCGRIAAESNGAFLYLTLPSGRELAYPDPNWSRTAIDGPLRRCVQGQRAGHGARPALRRQDHREHRAGDRARPAGRGDAARRARWLPDRPARARRARR